MAACSLGTVVQHRLSGEGQSILLECSLAAVVHHRMSGEGQSILLDPVVVVARTCEVQV